MKYELLPETIARLERYAAQNMVCMNWMQRYAQDGMVAPRWWYPNHVPPGNCDCPRCKFLRTLDSLKEPAEEASSRDKPSKSEVVDVLGATAGEAMRIAVDIWEDLERRKLLRDAYEWKDRADAVVMISNRLIKFLVDTR